MIGWILRRLKWLGLLGVFAPVIIAPAEYMSTDRANEMQRNGVEAVAEIEGGTRTKRRRSGTSFSLNLSWADKAGQVRTAEKVSIPKSLADQLIKDDQLISDKIKIRYLPDDPAREPVIVGQFERNTGDPVTNALTMFAGALPISIIGGLIFWTLRRRERRTVAA